MATNAMVQTRIDGAVKDEAEASKSARFDDVEALMADLRADD